MLQEIALDYIRKSGGVITRQDIQQRLGVHRNTWARYEKELLVSQRIQRVGRYHLEVTHTYGIPSTAPSMPAAAAYADVVTPPKHSSQRGRVERSSIEIRLDRLEEKIDRLLVADSAVCATTKQSARTAFDVLSASIKAEPCPSANERHNDTSNALPSTLPCTKTVQGCTTDAHSTVQGCTTDAHSTVQPCTKTVQGCTPDAHSTVQPCTKTVQGCTSEDALAHVRAGAFPPAEEIANAIASSIGETDAHGTMHTCTPQESGIERLAEKKALNRKRQAFIRIYEDAWSTQFQQRAVPISVLSNLKAFSSNEELAALSESEWQSCVAQWLADDRMARKRWPISHLIAGITTDYAPDLSVPCDDAEEGSDSTEAPTNSELDHLVAQGWLPYDRWREWPLFSEAPLLAKMLFSARWAWNGCEGVWPPIGARFSDEGLTIVTQGTDCGYWALEVIDALVHAAENAGHPLIAIVAGDRNYTWWTAPERQTA